MESRLLAQLRVRSAVSSSCSGQTSQLFRRCARNYNSRPLTVTDVSFWRSLVPKPLRKANRQQGRRLAKGWNPATYFIFMFLLIGSMSVHTIALRKKMEQHARQSAVRIGLLREVVEKIHRGEAVDVEKMLGTEDAPKEAEWDEMLRALEKEDAIRKHSKDRKGNGSEEKLKRPDQSVTKGRSNEAEAEAEALSGETSVPLRSRYF